LEVLKSFLRIETSSRPSSNKSNLKILSFQASKSKALKKEFLQTLPFCHNTVKDSFKD
jgi:hypothetical protein